MTKFALATLPRPGQWTYDDYCRLPADLLRHEIIDGRHYVSPAPDVDHQGLCTGLTVQLYSAIEQTKRGIVLTAPVDVRLGRRTVMQPDLLAIRSEWHQVSGRKFLDRAPDLVVEILSPSTSRRDRGLKLRRYRRAGVREYWLVDPQARAVEVFAFGSAPLAPTLAKERVRSTAFPGVVIDLRPLWRRLQRRPKSDPGTGSARQRS